MMQKNRQIRAYSLYPFESFGGPFLHKQTCALQKMHFYVCVNLTHSVSKPAILLNILRLFYTSYVLNNVYSISWVKLTLCVE